MKKLLLLMCLIGVILGAKVPQTAAVIPYAKKEGFVYFLLGQESSSDNWCGFGGFCDKELMLRIAWHGDQLYYRCAAREATEETKGVFGRYAMGLRGDDLSKALSKRMALRAQQQSMRFFQERVAITPLIIKRNDHKDYFIEVPYIDAQAFERAPNGIDAEKKAYAWLPAEEFIGSIREQYLKESSITQEIKNIRISYKHMSIRPSFARSIASEAMQAIITKIR